MKFMALILVGAALAALTLAIGCSDDSAEPVAPVVSTAAIATAMPETQAQQEPAGPTAVSRMDALSEVRPTETAVVQTGSPTAVPPMPPAISLQPGTQAGQSVAQGQGAVPTVAPTEVPVDTAVPTETPTPTVTPEPTPMGFFLQAPTQTPTPPPTATPTRVPVVRPTATPTPDRDKWEGVLAVAAAADETNPLTFDSPGMIDLDDGQRILSYDALGPDAVEFDLFVNEKPLGEDNNISRVFVRGPYIVFDTYRKFRFTEESWVGGTGSRYYIAPDRVQLHYGSDGMDRLVLDRSDPLGLGAVSIGDFNRGLNAVWVDTGEPMKFRIDGDSNWEIKFYAFDPPPVRFARQFPEPPPLKLEQAIMYVPFENLFFLVSGIEGPAHREFKVRAGDECDGLRIDTTPGEVAINNRRPEGRFDQRRIFVRGFGECVGLDPESTDVYNGRIQLEIISKSRAGRVLRRDIFDLGPEDIYYSYDVKYLTYGLLGEEVLRAVNLARAERGVPPVELGERLVSQNHAQDSLLQCYASHWDRAGLKPHMRYAQDGGYHANAELWVSTFADDRCLVVEDYPWSYNNDSYRVIRGLNDIRELVEHSVEQLAASPVHEAALFNPHFSKINFGFAFDDANWRLVLHLETATLEDTGAAIATMSPAGISMEAELTPDAYERGYRFAWAELLKDQPRPHADAYTHDSNGLRIQNLNKTHCYDEGGSFAVFYDSRSAELSSRDYSFDTFECQGPFNKYLRDWWEGFPEDIYRTLNRGTYGLYPTDTDRNPPVVVSTRSPSGTYPAAVWEEGRRFGFDATVPSTICGSDDCSQIEPGIYGLKIYVRKAGQDDAVAIGHQVIWVGVDAQTGMLLQQ